MKGMLAFLTVFFLIYGGLHWYAFRRADKVLVLGSWAGPLAFFMIVMVLAPILVRLLEREGFETAGRFLALGGYTWMGFLFLFVCTSFSLDLARWFFALAQYCAPHRFPRFPVGPEALFWLTLGVALLTSFYGMYEARMVRVERRIIASDRIPAPGGGVRVMQISDLHLGLLVGARRLEGILALVGKERPDVLVATGDLLDGQTDSVSGLAAMLAEVTPRYGKFAVTGNHEYYVGLDHSLAFFKAAGFTVLRGESRQVGGFLRITGVDDPTGAAMGGAPSVSEPELLRRRPDKRFRLLLKHRPEVEPESLGLFDVQLSGHVHGGQIFPFNLVTRLAYPVRSGLTRLASGAFLYVSRGAGTWGPPIRFLAPPDVAVIDLVPAETACLLGGQGR